MTERQRETERRGEGERERERGKGRERGREGEEGGRDTTNLCVAESKESIKPTVKLSEPSRPTEARRMRTSSGSTRLTVGRKYGMKCTSSHQHTRKPFTLPSSYKENEWAMRTFLATSKLTSEKYQLPSSLLCTAY